MGIRQKAKGPDFDGPLARHNAGNTEAASFMHEIISLSRNIITIITDWNFP